MYMYTVYITHTRIHMTPQYTLTHTQIHTHTHTHTHRLTSMLVALLRNLLVWASSAMISSLLPWSLALALAPGGRRRDTLLSRWLMNTRLRFESYNRIKEKKNSRCIVQINLCTPKSYFLIHLWVHINYRYKAYKFKG